MVCIKIILYDNFDILIYLNYYNINILLKLYFFYIYILFYFILFFYFWHILFLANYVARTLPEEDYVIGFFVSCFERINPNEKNNKENNKSKDQTNNKDKNTDKNNNNLGVIKTTGSIKKKKNKKNKKKNKKSTPTVSASETSL